MRGGGGGQVLVMAQMFGSALIGGKTLSVTLLC